jgi:sugar O-acyltransferase (sialic acid O-acetyltransferase NeuD family)
MSGTGLLVWGAGGHGRVVADLVRASGERVAGYVDRDPARFGAVVDPLGGRVVATEDELLQSLNAGGFPCGAGGIRLGIGNNAVRTACLRRLSDTDVPALVHPSAVVSGSALLGRAAVVLPLALVHSAARVGEAAIVNSGAVVEHDCTLEEGVHVSPGAVLAGGVRVGAGAWIGAGAVVIPEVQVGPGAVVGAGAVVIRDVPPGATVVGNPARIIRTQQAREP